MIKAEKLTKKFGSFCALNELSCVIPEGSIYGLVGSNGAGKSTFLRLLAGVYKPDGGSIRVNDEDTFDNDELRERMAFVPDDLYFIPGSDIKRMSKLYGAAYKNYDYGYLDSLIKLLGLPATKNISTFSKGMKRQAATILALAARPEIVFFDETFDGLDPVMRNTIKKLICSDVAERKATVIITSHSLRELEDTCDQLALLHKGGLVLESDVSNLKTSMFKVQIGLIRPFNREEFDKLGLDIRTFSSKGSVATMIIRGDKDEASEKLQTLSPVLLDILPLSLEEVFVHEMDALGYKFEDLGGEEVKKNA